MYSQLGKIGLAANALTLKGMQAKRESNRVTIPDVECDDTVDSFVACEVVYLENA
jgi:hypothetical protein